MNVTKNADDYRKLNTSSYCLEDSAEHESKSREYEQMRISEHTATIAVNKTLMEEIPGHQNLMKACKRVIQNKGSQGVDGMDVTQIMPYFLEQEEEIRVKAELTQVIRGWMNYFKIGDMKKVIRKIDQWLRHKIRCNIWKSWKKPKTRRQKLESLGLNKEKARMVAGSREGLWKVSNYQDMKRAITNEKLSRAGYPTFSRYYL